MKHEIRGYIEVRDAARNFEVYSSDLQGDRDTRDYKQLPLEVDPPRHTLMREAVQPLFLGAAIAPKVPQFEALARKLIGDITAAGGGEIGRDLALPFVIGCLTVIYDRPQDYDEWVSWGPDVWTAETYAAGLPAARSGATLQAYLDRVFDAVEANPNPNRDSWDVWDYVSAIEIEGVPITRKEMQGIANVLLAGGRDTVIKLVTGLVWHLIGNPADREFLQSNEAWFNRTIAEMVRFLTPLPKMERVVHDPASTMDGQFVDLSFVSANYDLDHWDAPEVVDIHRDRKPHLAFGFGRHSCMGMNITEHEAGAFLRVLLSEWPGWQFDGEPEIEWGQATGKNGEPIRFIDRFDALRVKTA